MVEKTNANLAKILWYYNLIPNTVQPTQKIICPFHADLNPSMIVNLYQDKWFCFGCQLSGDAVKFVYLFENKINGLNELQSYYKYMQILKSNTCSSISYTKNIPQQNIDAKHLHDIAHDYYYGLATIDWLTDQQEEVIQSKAYMQKRGVMPETLNLCKAKATYKKDYPIIFPLYDNSDFKGWVCRTNDPIIETKRKYLFNKGFSRATTLVGDYNNKSALYIVEGYIDRLKMIQYGVRNVVAILGWKMSDEQYKKIQDTQIKTIISVLDNDKCGIQGTEYLKKIFNNNVFRWQYLRGVKDIGESSKQQFDAMLNRTKYKIEKG